MRLKLISSITILFLLLSNCQNQGSKADENIKTEKTDTDFFQGYLKKTFDLSIPDTLHYYLVLPTSACVGCNQRAAIVFKELLDCCKEKITVIIGKHNKHLVLDDVEDVSIYRDDRGMISRLPLRLYNPSIIKTDKNKIVKTTVIPTSDLELMLNEIYLEIKQD